jgi:hypothetical protein
MALSPFSLGFWGKTLLKEKRHFFYLFYDLMNLHKKFYTTLRSTFSIIEISRMGLRSLSLSCAKDAPRLAAGSFT